MLCCDFSNRKFKKNFVIKFMGLDPNPTVHPDSMNLDLQQWYGIT